MNRLIRHLIVLLLIPALVVDPRLAAVVSLSNPLSPTWERARPLRPRGEGGIFLVEAMAETSVQAQTPIGNRAIEAGIRNLTRDKLTQSAAPVPTIVGPKSFPPMFVNSSMDHLRPYPGGDFPNPIIQMKRVDSDEGIRAVARKHGRAPGQSPKVMAGWPHETRDQITSFLMNASADDIGFDRNLTHGKVLLIGASDGREIFGLIEKYPQIGEIHIVDTNEFVFKRMEVWAQAWRESGRGPLPRIYGYRMNTLELPVELRGQIDLIVSSSVFDGDFFDADQLSQALREIVLTLKEKGGFISISSVEAIRQYFDERVMHRSSRNSFAEMRIKRLQPVQSPVPAAPTAGGLDDSGATVRSVSVDAVRMAFAVVAPHILQMAEHDYFERKTDPSRGLQMDDGIKDPSASDSPGLLSRGTRALAEAQRLLPEAQTDLEKLRTLTNLVIPELNASGVDMPNETRAQLIRMLVDLQVIWGARAHSYRVAYEVWNSLKSDAPEWTREFFQTWAEFGNHVPAWFLIGRVASPESFDKASRNYSDLIVALSQPNGDQILRALIAARNRATDFAIMEVLEGLIQQIAWTNNTNYALAHRLLHDARRMKSWRRSLLGMIETRPAPVPHAPRVFHDEYRNPGRRRPEKRPQPEMRRYRSRGLDPDEREEDTGFPAGIDEPSAALPGGCLQAGHGTRAAA